MKRTIYFNGNVITVDDNNTVAEAVLVENGRILKVGTNEELLSQKDENTNVVDLEGKTMVPGFIDPHGHIAAIAQTLLLVQLGDAISVAEVKERLRNYIANTKLPKDAWVIGFGYDNTKFEDKQHPTKFDLDDVSTEIGIYCTHASGHLAVTNSFGLEAYGYSGTDYVVPEGGVVQTVSPDSREANGILEENAIMAEEKKGIVPAPKFEQVLDSLVRAQDLYAQLGITTAQDASLDPGYDQMLTVAGQMGKLKIDILGYALMPFTEKLMKTNEGTPKRDYVNHYKVAGGKTFLDGSPQGKTAWLTEAYYKAPEGESEDYCGYATQTDEDMIAYYKMCIENNWQVHTHSNGDAAIDQFFRCYEKALELAGNTTKKTDLRPVLVHCQAVRKDQVKKMAELGAVPTFFNDHVWFWGDYHYDSVFGPERAQNISPLGWALEEGLKFTIHQDPPVKMPDQILGMHNAVNRKTQSGRVLGEQHKISTLEALKAVTINGAYGYFEEDIKGSIEEGKYADFVILDKNILEVNPEEIKNIKVLETIKEGNTIYKA